MSSHAGILAILLHVGKVSACFCLGAAAWLSILPSVLAMDIRGRKRRVPRGSVQGI